VSAEGPEAGSQAGAVGPAAVIGALRERGLTIATCESLTAGLLSATLAEVPGASAVLRGGLVTYATALKAELAGVDPDLLAAHGAVDPQVAREMARGAVRACGADLGVSCTGVAGPDPQDGKPVGRVYLALARSGGGVRTAELDLTGSRREIREATVRACLDLVLAACAEDA
jgi:nicotinamide-nucleotide amidase